MGKHQKVNVGDKFVPSASLTNDTIDLINHKHVGYVPASTNLSKYKNYDTIQGIAIEEIYEDDFVNVEFQKVDDEVSTFLNKEVKNNTPVFYATKLIAKNCSGSVIANGVISISYQAYSKIKDIANNITVLAIDDTQTKVIIEISSANNITYSKYRPFLTTLVKKELESGKVETSIVINSGYYNVNGKKFAKVSNTTLLVPDNYKGEVCLYTTITGGKIETPRFVFASPDMNNFPIAYIEDGIVHNYYPCVAYFLISRLCHLATLVEAQEIKNE